MAHAGTIDISRENRQAGPLARTLVVFGLAVGLVGLAGALGLGAAVGWPKLLKSYLVAYIFGLSIGLGALFFVMLQHLTRAGWSVAVRRLAEVLTGLLPLLAVLALPILAGVRVLYPWADPASLDPDIAALVAEKRPYLNEPFFIGRVVAYLVIWTLLARYFLGRSVAQDASGDVDLTRRLERMSAPGMLLYALTVTFAAFDLVMSLKPAWYSTIFGVYLFAGSVVGALAALILLLSGLQASGRLTQVITPEHYHDLGKLLFAFVVFWAYIAFSQYMLIWYANLPETTIWFAWRQTGAWAAISVVLLLGHFVLPFLALIARGPKRRRGLLAGAAVWMLLMHWLDVYYLIKPDGQGAVPFHLADVACLLLVVGLGVAVVGWQLGRQSLLAERDPRLPESVAFQNF